MTRFIAWATAILVFAISPSALGWTFPINVPYHLVNGFWSCSNKCYHLGQDIVPDSNPVGTEVHAICSGRVVEAVFRPLPPGNYGGRVLVQCQIENEPIVVLYGHLQQQLLVHTGDQVNEGDIIGKLGTSQENGGSTPHLHIGTHRGAYRSSTECDIWSYGGYTATTSITPSNPCYCNIMDNWFDPMELMGLREKELRIVRNTSGPDFGYPNYTNFIWNMAAEGGRGAPITATLLITNPGSNLEYPFVMGYSPRSVNPFWFEYVKKLQTEGLYTFRYRLETCAESVEDTTARVGPNVTSTCLISSEEICDNRDNDCNGRVDDGLASRCHNECGNVGTMSCTTGMWSPCNASPCLPPPACTPATCASLGKQCGTWGNGCGNTLNCGQCSSPPPPSCVPSTELCNNQDDNCNGQVDESVTQSCSNSCGNVGMQYCTRGSWSACNAQACPPPPPACTPATCASLGKQCGSWNNGCGNTMNCGGCTSPDTCNDGRCSYTPTAEQCGGEGISCCRGNGWCAPGLYCDTSSNLCRR